MIPTRSSTTARAARVALALALPLLAACGGDPEREQPAVQPRAATPRLARDTTIGQPRAPVWSAALRAAAQAGYRLAWFDARLGAAELVRDSGVWMQLSVPRDTTDSARTRVTVLASHAPTHAPAMTGTRAPQVPDDTAIARARELVRRIVEVEAVSMGPSLLADTAVVRISADTVEACRGAVVGEWWVEIDHRRDARRCATPRVFGIEQNVAVMQRVEDLPLYSLVYVCSERARVPRGFSVAYSMMDGSRCRGAKADTANVLVLRKAF